MPTSFSGLSLSLPRAIKLAASRCAHNRVGFESPFREYSELSETILGTAVQRGHQRSNLVKVGRLWWWKLVKGHMHPPIQIIVLSNTILSI